MAPSSTLWTDGTASTADTIFPIVPLLSSRLEDFISHIPLCAVSCIERYCAASNITCIRDVYKTALDSCIITSCQRSVAIRNRVNTEQMCGTAVRNRANKLYLLLVSMSALPTLFVIARLVFQRFFSTQRRLQSSDWIIAATIFVGIPSIHITTSGLLPHGLGVDIWGLQPSDAVIFGRLFFITELLYVLLMSLIKISLTLFYLDIFSGHTIRRLLWATIAFHVAAAVAFLVSVVFEYTPVSFQWNQYDYLDKSIQGHCNNTNATGWANSVVSIISDLWLLLIPLSQVKSLRLPWQKKLGAALMFSTGTIITVISFIRLASIRNYRSTTNPTWYNYDITWWSTIEVEIGLVCSCMPSIRLILVHIARRVYGSQSPLVPVSLSRPPTAVQDTRIGEKEATMPHSYLPLEQNSFNITAPLPALANNINSHKTLSIRSTISEHASTVFNSRNKRHIAHPLDSIALGNHSHSSRPRSAPA